MPAPGVVVQSLRGTGSRGPSMNSETASPAVFGSGKRVRSSNSTEPTSRLRYLPTQTSFVATGTMNGSDLSGQPHKITVCNNKLHLFVRTLPQWHKRRFTPLSGPVLRGSRGSQSASGVSTYLLPRMSDGRDSVTVGRPVPVRRHRQTPCSQRGGRARAGLFRGASPFCSR